MAITLATAPTLTGSAKQIAWAAEIRSATVDAWNNALAWLEARETEDAEIDGDELDNYRSATLRHIGTLAIEHLDRAEHWIDARDHTIANVRTLHYFGWNAHVMDKDLGRMPELASLPRFEIRKHSILSDLHSIVAAAASDNLPK